MSVAAARGPSDEAVLHSTVPSPCGPAAARWVLTATILGSSMAFIDGTAVNVALPVLQQDLKASVSNVQWVVEAYALFLASLVLVGGSLADRFGRRRSSSSVRDLRRGLCSPAASPRAPARSSSPAPSRDVGAALLVPSSLAILGAAFSPAARGRAVGTWAAMTSITAAIGPALGGWLVQVVSWRAVFLVNLPLAAAVVWIAFRTSPRRAIRHPAGSISEAPLSRPWVSAPSSTG